MTYTFVGDTRECLKQARAGLLRSGSPAVLRRAVPAKVDPFTGKPVPHMGMRVVEARGVLDIDDAGEIWLVTDELDSDDCGNAFVRQIRVGALHVAPKKQ